MKYLQYFDIVFSVILAGIAIYFSVKFFLRLKRRQRDLNADHNTYLGEKGYDEKNPIILGKAQNFLKEALNHEIIAYPGRDAFLLFAGNRREYGFHAKKPLMTIRFTSINKVTAVFGDSVSESVIARISTELRTSSPNELRVRALIVILLNCRIPNTEIDELTFVLEPPNANDKAAAIKEKLDRYLNPSEIITI